MTWNHILNWKLLDGSHKFPGPDGGTCINEAAIIAAGFEYRSVSSADDCPPCFSHAIASYVIRLNDLMPDALRQDLLMPFVTRLAGTADTPEIELQRVNHIVVQTIKRIVPISLRAAGLEKEARNCEGANDLATAAHAATAAKAANDAAYAANDAAYAANDANNATYAAYAVTYAANAVTYAANAVTYAANAAADKRQIFEIAVTIMDEAIALGKQAESIETALVAQRMEEARRLVRV